MPKRPRPNRCIACQGTGKSTRGVACVPCQGTGKVQPRTDDIVKMKKKRKRR